MLVPTGTSSDIIAVLQREIASLLKLPDVQERMGALGYQTVGSTPEDCATQIAAEFSKWEKVVRAAGIKAE